LRLGQPIVHREIEAAIDDFREGFDVALGGGYGAS
jgi:hypothetical protein